MTLINLISLTKRKQSIDNKEKSVLGVQRGNLQPGLDHGTFTFLDGKGQPLDGVEFEIRPDAPKTKSKFWLKKKSRS